MARRSWAVALAIPLLLGGWIWFVDRQAPEGLWVHEGLEATVFAEAPWLTNPTNLDVDARGRVWVVEGFNYRTHLNPENPVREEGDRIVILEDTDGDGRADVHKVFYQGRDIDAAMGIAVLGDRVIVSAYENVFVFTDTDGDDRPDRKEVLYKFGKKNHDHTVHAFLFGPDGRLYFNIGNESDTVMTAAGEVIVDRAGNRVIDEGKPYREGMVFRVEPDGSDFEVLGFNFRNPYEATVDSYGTIWQSDNDDDGNRATRINYVMEYGNFGFKDELTGADWRIRRTGMHEEIPLRHWHLNDPGVVPNVLQTGAGSPSGITVYEGELLPERFRGALIHADPGPNVVRAYPVKKRGAGYTAESVDIVKGVRDPWFRPVDVAVAPDGSLFVADWYDPGVGGHDVGDLTHGRILRIAPAGTAYRVRPPDVETDAAAVGALLSPHFATRYLGYTALERRGAGAEAALRRVWQGSDPSAALGSGPRHRARALWLLAGLGERGAAYIEEAIRDPNPDLRITGLRAARRAEFDILPLARRLVDDPAPEVRREVAIALRHHPAPEAAELWARLAEQHDPADRWYLEALGIGADRQWDRYFAAWRSRVGERWSTPAGRQIVWRSRAAEALPLLARLIEDPGTSAAERLRYFRAFDFHAEPERSRVLSALLEVRHAAQDEIRALALTHLAKGEGELSPRARAALGPTLDAMRGTLQFVELVERFDVRDRIDELVELGIQKADSTAGVEATSVALRWEAADRFRQIIRSGEPGRVYDALRVLGLTGGAAAYGLLDEVILDPELPMPVRQAAVRSMSRTLGGEGRLLRMVAADRLPEELEPVAAEVLFSSYRNETREAAARHLTPPLVLSAEGRELPPAGALALRSGDAGRGREVYARLCASCHVARGEGLDFGPGLSEIGEKLPKEELYEAILHPSAGISFGYEGWVLRLRDGTEALGIIQSETADELVLRLPAGITRRYDPSEIVSRTRLDRSLMPEGLQTAMTQQELVDLVEYLSGLKR